MDMGTLREINAVASDINSLNSKIIVLEELFKGESLRVSTEKYIVSVEIDPALLEEVKTVVMSHYYKKVNNLEQAFKNM